MSWLARSIANTLHLDDEDDTSARRSRPDDAGSPQDQLRDGTLYTEDHRLTDSDDVDSYYYNHGVDEDRDSENDNDLGRGMKEDLSEFKETLTRQFWGVASFLAPPPPPPPPPPPLYPLRQKSGFVQPELKYDWTGSDNDEDHDDEKEEEELVEYDDRDSGQFGEFSKLSQLKDYNTNTVENAIGITEEVLAFAKNIAHHPETWLDFPLSEEEEFDDFDISDAQYDHALAVEHLAPRLAALRIELCPAHMSEGYFWTVYFVLLHSRLNKHDADLLSSLQIVQARAMWMQELQKKTKDESYLLGRSNFHTKESADLMHENFMHSYEDTHSRYMSDRMSPYEPSTPHGTRDNESEKRPFSEVEYIDKSVIKEDPAPEPQEKMMVAGPSVEIPVQDDDYDDDDDWLKEDADLIGYSGSIIMGNEDDVSFSDLEDDIDCTMPVKSKIVSSEWSSMAKTS